MRYLILSLIFLSGCTCGPRVVSATRGEVPDHFGVEVHTELASHTMLSAVGAATERTAMALGYDVSTTTKNPVLVVTLSHFDYSRETPTIIIANAQLVDDGQVRWSAAVSDTVNGLTTPGEALDITISAMIATLPSLKGTGNAH